MKKNSYNLPNLSALSAIVVLALITSGCGNTNQTANTPAVQVDYKDGTYSATGSYKSPAGPEQIGVTLTLKNNIVTDATVTPEATAKRSVMMQNDFAANYKPLVVGKNINDINLTKVSGSSLTPAGFNDALANIESQAK